MHPDDLPTDLVKVARAAQRLGVDVKAIHRAINQGKLPGYKVLGRRMVSAADLGLVAEPVKPRGAAAPPRRRPPAAVLARLRARGHRV